MARAEKSAYVLLDRIGLSEPPIDPDVVARALDIAVLQVVKEPSVPGMLLRRAGQVVIGLNLQRPETARRFAMAHLIGHHQVHRSRDLLLDVENRYIHGEVHSFPTDREEAEANQFAAALLAPEPAVRRLAREVSWEVSSQLVDKLAERFKLSRGVMGYRLMSLGITLDC